MAATIEIRVRTSSLRSYTHVRLPLPQELLLILRRLAEHFAAASCMLANNKGPQG